MTDIPPTRQECIDKFVKSRLESIASESLYEKFPHSSFQDAGPQWFELRESVVRVLFEMDHEFTREEIHADCVRKNCL